MIILFKFILFLQLISNAYSIKYQEKIYQGRFSRDIKQFELVVPHKITQDGVFLSYSLPNYFTHNYMMKRKKRDSSHPDLIHINLYFNKKDHHIELWPNHNFLTSNTISEYHYPGSDMSVSSRKMKRLQPVLCHYTGNIRSIDQSSAALSLCDGIAGYIKIDNGIYFIEPVKDFGPNEMGHHLHIIHTTNEENTDANSKRKDDDDDVYNDNGNNFNNINEIVQKRSNKICGTTNKWETGWAKAFKRYFRENNNNNNNIQDYNNNIIRKRSSSTSNSYQRYLEILVVADHKFIEYHKDKDYENYILTIMNMVSDFYHDASVGNQMDIIISRIIYLDENVVTLDLEVSPDATKTLKSFCKWQNNLNPKNNQHPQHHDISILLTRHDICADENKNCDLLGLAYMTSACTPTEACSINEDQGLLLGIVVTHEIGHIVGCGHDDEADAGCSSKANDKSYHVMSPYVKMATSVWSTCSKKFMTELFENKLGECLSNEPQESLYKNIEMLPGSVYDADYQCGLLFTNSTHCPINMDKFCEKLFCQITSDKCRSNGEPPADGTKCGHNKWCYKQNCIVIGQRPKSRAGGWGKWNEYSVCSRTCGGGVQISQRHCDNPKPKNGGLYCLGERKRIKVCNIKKCPKNTLPFRAQQCKEFDTIPRNGKFHKWTPYFPSNKLQENSCVLYCINELHVYVKLEARVKDGTPCKSGTNYMCITGECRKIGCDWILDSNAIEDKCGLCKGDGTNCNKITGIFKEIDKGYRKVIKIPRGARNIEIIEMKPSDNTLAISNESGKLFFLNANQHEENDGEKSLGNNLAIYMHPELNKEELLLPGPINQNLIFYIMFFKPENVGYKYEYYLRKKNQKNLKKNKSKNTRSEKTFDSKYTPSINEKLHWEYVEWSGCSLRCGGGESFAIAVCVNDNNNGVGEVSDEFCLNEKKPEKKTKICNRQECRVRWHTSEFGLCSGCKHKPGVQIREVWCAREPSRWEETDILTSEDKCIEIKPTVKQLCTGRCPEACRNTRSIIEQDKQLDYQTYKELFKKINILIMEPEGIIIEMAKSFDDNNINPKQQLHKETLENIRNNDDVDYLEVENNDKTTCLTEKENENKNYLIDENQNIYDNNSLNKFKEEQKFMFIGHYPIKFPHIYGSDEELRVERDINEHQIVQDKIPKEQITIEDVEIKELPQLQNLSDLAYEKLGDKLSGTIDLSHEKVFTGNDAICMLKKENIKNKSIKHEK